MDEREIFIQARQIAEADDLARFLHEACHGDTALRSRVEGLLGAYARAESFFESPAVALAATADIAPIAERPGTQIGPYKLVEQIGEGGMGVVYMAVQKEPVHRKVALKVIKPGMDTREVIARFAVEEQALAIMDHPHIAKVHDAGTTESGRPYFVMELVSGVPLTQYCDDNDLTTRQRLELFVPVCQAVQHAHQKGIIHRDIKPTNILVPLHDGVPVPKIIDFGIAKAINQELTANTAYTGQGQMVGTPLYMSPEQAEHGRDIDTRSDIYSLGVLLYELLTGSTPFDGEQLKDAGYDEVRRVIREQEPPRPSSRISTLGKAATTVSEHRKTSPVELSNSLRHELDWIVMKALEKDRARRYQTANDFARDIQRYLNDEPVDACPPSTAYRLKKFVRRHKTGVLATAAVGLALILGAGVAAGQAYRATKAEKLAEEQLQIANQQERLAKKQAQLAQKQKRLAEEAATREGKLRIEAESARKQADTVVDFLVETFRSPDPQRDGRTITVAELLDKARDRVAKDFHQDLGIQAQLLDAIGKTYKALGLPREAVELLEKARDIRRSTLGTEDLRTLETMEALADAYFEAECHEQALGLSQELLQTAQAVCGPEDTVTLRVRRLEAECYVAMGQLDKGIDLLDELVTLSQKARGAEHRDTLQVMNGLGWAYHFANREDEALKLHQQVFDVEVRTMGREHSDTIASLHNLGATYAALRRYDEAIPLLEEAVQLHTKVNGPQHPRKLQTINSLALAYSRVGRLDEGIALLEQQWQRTTSTLGLDHPAMYRSGGNLAMIYQQAGRFDDAVQVLTELLEAIEPVDKSPSERTIGLLEGLARLNVDKGDFDTAVGLLETVLRKRSEKSEPTSPQIVQTKISLALTLSRMGRQQEATALADEALGALRSGGTVEPLSLCELGMVCSRARRYEDAVRILEEALTLNNTSRLLTDPTTSQLTQELTQAYLNLGHIVEAIAFFQNAVEMQQKTWGKNDPHTLETMCGLAEAMRKAGRGAESVEIEKEVLELWAETPASDPSRRSDPPFCVACIHREAGQFDKAVSVATDRLEERQAKYGSGDYRTISARRCLARAYAAANQLDEAANLFNEVIASFANTHGPEHPSTLETMQWLADVRRQAGKFEESVDLLQRTLTGQQHTLGPEHPDTLTTMIQLGSLLTTQSEYARAEPLLRDGYIGFAKRGEANPTPFDREQTRKACAQLVQLFEKSGHPDKATAWKQKLAALTAEPKKDEGNK